MIPWNAKNQDPRYWMEKFGNEIEGKYRTRHQRWETTHIYLIRDRLSGIVKIGQSSDPKARVVWLQRYGPGLATLAERDLELVHTWRDVPQREHWLHCFYWNKLISNEWFRLEEEDVRSIVRRSTAWARRCRIR